MKWPNEKALGFRYAGVFREAGRPVVMFADAADVFRFWDMYNDEWLTDYNSAQAYEFDSSGALFVDAR